MQKHFLTRLSNGEGTLRGDEGLVRVREVNEKPRTKEKEGTSEKDRGKSFKTKGGGKTGFSKYTVNSNKIKVYTMNLIA